MRAGSCTFFPIAQSCWTHEGDAHGAVRVALVRPAGVGARGGLGLGQRRGAERPALERALVAERADDVAEERGVLLHERDDVDLVEDDARVQDVERAVVDRAREHDVLEELQAVRPVHLARDVRVPDRDRLVELRGLLQELAVVRLVRRELWVVCRVDVRRDRTYSGLHSHSSMPTTPRNISSSMRCSNMPWSLKVTRPGHISYILCVVIAHALIVCMRL
jgi:hypothetical protein